MKKNTKKIDFDHVIELILNAQNKVYTAINRELVLLNWEIGKYVSAKVNSGDWGDGVVVQLAEHIKSQHPNLKGFTKRGLYRMKQFYETYHTIEIVSPLLTQLSWSNHLMIFVEMQNHRGKAILYTYFCQGKIRCNGQIVGSF